MSYVFENRRDHYQVQHPIASARFYPDRTEFWDENFSERAVAREDWSVERLEGENWREMNFTPATISYNLVNEEDVQLVRTASSPLGTLRTTYIFRRGSPLKIVPEFTASENMSVRFAWRPEVEGAASYQVRKARLRDLDPARYWGSVEGEVERDVGVSFFGGSTRLVANLGWWEEAGDENLLIGVETTSENLLVHFGNFSLDTDRNAVLDPTLQIGSTACDSLENWSSSYGGVRDAPTGSFLDETWFAIGQYYWAPTNYHIWRGFVYFDTSSIPDSATMTSAILSLYKFDMDRSDRDFDVIVQSGMPDYPHDSLIREDYDRTHYSDNGGSFNTSDFTSGYNDIVLNENGREWIRKDDVTKLCLRSSRDIDGIEPTPFQGDDYANEVIMCEAWGTNRPKLTVIYEIPPVENAWVFWRFNDNDIDNVPGKYDGSMGMSGPSGTTSGVWRADLPQPNSGNIGWTIYWRVHATTAEGEDNWSPVYTGGVITNSPFSIDLFAGWNLVSFPVASEDDTPRNLFEGVTYSMFYWDPAMGGYRTADPDEPVELGVGYWVNVDNDMTVTTAGVPVENFSIDLVAGWNLIGFPVTSADTTPDNLFGDVEYSMFEWDPIAGGYVSLTGSTDPVELGKGYWVKIDEDMTVTVPL